MKEQVISPRNAQNWCALLTLKQRNIIRMGIIPTLCLIAHAQVLGKPHTPITTQLVISDSCGALFPQKAKTHKNNLLSEQYFQLCDRLNLLYLKKNSLGNSSLLCDTPSMTMFFCGSKFTTFPVREWNNRETQCRTPTAHQTGLLLHNVLQVLREPLPWSMDQLLCWKHLPIPWSQTRLVAVTKLTAWMKLLCNYRASIQHLTSPRSTFQNIVQMCKVAWEFIS